MTHVLIVSPASKPGAPAFERVRSYREYFGANGVTVSERPSPGNIIQLLRLICHIYGHGVRNVLITMPPFRNWVLCYLPFVHTVLDIRDGWSIAMRAGYGGSLPPRKLKAFVARVIEKHAIASSTLTITCTQGLQEYLEKLSGRRLHLIRNGISDGDYQLAAKLRVNRSNVSNEDQRTFVCAGKFSEYGAHHVEQVIEVINSRYGDKRCVLKVIGADESANDWVSGYLEERFGDRIKLEMCGRLSKEQLYQVMAPAFCAIAVIRDPSYEYGTKIYDYIALGLPVLNYFEADSDFKAMFSGFLDAGGSSGAGVEVRRSILVQDLDLAFLHAK